MDYFLVSFSCSYRLEVIESVWVPKSSRIDAYVTVYNNSYIFKPNTDNHWLYRTCSITLTLPMPKSNLDDSHYEVSFIRASQIDIHKRWIGKVNLVKDGSKQVLSWIGFTFIELDDSIKIEDASIVMSDWHWDSRLNKTNANEYLNVKDGSKEVYLELTGTDENPVIKVKEPCPKHYTGDNSLNCTCK